MIKFPPGSIYLLFISLLVNGCKIHNSGNIEGDLNISGIIYGNSNATLILEELTPTDIVSIDTLYTEADGSFRYTLYLKEASFYRLRLNKDEFVLLAPEPNESIYITADSERFAQSYQVSGSEGSAILWQLNQSMRKNKISTDSLRSIYMGYKNDPSKETARQEIKSLYKNLIALQKDYTLKVVEENPESLASIFALYQFLDGKQKSIESRHLDSFEELAKNLSSKYPRNKHVINLKRRINDIKRENHIIMASENNLAAGKPAPDISLPDPQGKQLSLSSLKGNLVLIDFWAAWCPPCRDAHPKLRTLYNKYRNSGFEIYSISLDRTRNQWLHAIQNDSLPWKHVSDLRFMNSPAVSLYNVVEVPHFVLIDREGNIIERDLNIQQIEALIKENI